MTALVPAQRRVPGVRRRPVALMYHGFSEGVRAHDPYDLTVPRANLEAQLAHLSTAGWAPLDLDQYLRAWDRPTSARSFLVTIDDALQSVLDVGAPALHAAGVPSVLFVPPGLAGGTTGWLDQTPDDPILDADGLKALSELGVELGVHGYDHLTMVGMSDADLVRHTVEARECLADLTGVVARSFAYPFGDVDARAIEAVRRAGYTVAFSVYRDEGRLAISRSDVKPGDSLSAFRLKLIPRYRVVWRLAGSVKPFRRALRRSAQRA